MENRHSYVISIVVTAVLLAVLWIICPICFQNNDDKILMYLTAGFTTGTPEIGTIFGSFYYYGIIALLYRIYSGVAWYTIIELLMVAISLWIICNSLIQSLGRFFGVLIYVLMFLLCFMHFSTALQYTATAGVVAGAAVCSLIMSFESDSLRNKEFVISLLLLVTSYGIRKQFGIVCLGAILCVMFFQLFKGEKILVIKKTGIILIVFLVAFTSNYLYEKASGIAEFNDYYAWAGTWNDYPHLQFEDDAEGVYESVGWDETLYQAASNWFFMDENLTKENFQKIVSSYDNNDVSLRDYYDRAHNLLLSSMIVNIQVVLWILILCFVNLHSLAVRQFNKKIITADCLFIMFFAVAIYFLIEGRFPMRAYQALVFIFMTPSILVGLSLVGHDDRKIIKPALIACVFVVTIIAYRVRPETNIFKYTYTVAHDVFRTRDIEKGMVLEDYAINHPDDLFIYDLDLALPANPFQVYQTDMPDNLLFWGGWFYNTPMYWKQIATNGLDQLYAEDFLNGRVYFCGLEVSPVLQDYMYARYPDINCDIVDELDDIKIYRFSK